MKRYLVFCSLLFALILSSSSFASGVKLVDYLVSSSGLVGLLVKHGVSAKEAGQIEGYVFSSLNSLAPGKGLSASEFNKILSNIKMTGQDAKIKKELQVLFDKSGGEVTKEDLVKSINNIIYLANRYGKSILITCADCVSESLSKNGFKFTVENIQNTTTRKILMDVLPSNPRDLQNFISAKVKKLGLGDYSKVRPGVISLDEEKTLALFLASYENGSPEFKAVADSIKKLSTKNGKTNLFDPLDPNKLWKLVTTDFSSQELYRMSSTLDEAAELSSVEKLKVEEAFNRVVKKKAEKSTELMEKYKLIKNRRCFFK